MGENETARQLVYTHEGGEERERERLKDCLLPSEEGSLPGKLNTPLYP